MERENVVLNKSIDFAIRIVKLSRFLREQHNEFVLSKQILRSGTPTYPKLNVPSARMINHIGLCTGIAKR
ncbi:MAG: four helix bundle protein [Alphaproteobacteria bacterium]|nr:four helix bundle protein [Alphaproteobacteria bacterium]